MRLTITARNILFIVAFLFGLFTTGLAKADYPDRPITLVVPFPPGGSTDIHLRQIAKEAGEILGQTIITENRPGASGSVALTAVKGDKPDGYTLTVLVPTSLRLPLLQDMAYDPIEDFTYISMLSSYTYVVAVPAESPFESWQDVLAYARDNPGKLNYGNAGTYASTHLVMEEIAKAEGVEWNAIPYKGDGDQVQDLSGNRLDLGTPSIGGVASMVDGGKVRLLALLSDKRINRYPDVPTLPEEGTDIFAFVPYGIVGPAGMDPKVVEVLAQTFKQVSQSEANKKLVSELGSEVVFSTPEEFKQWAIDSTDKEKQLIAELEGQD